MKIFRILFLIIIAGCTATNKTITNLNEKNLKGELLRLNTETALIVQSQAIDEYPIWSKNADFIGCNIMGKWYKIRLTNIQLEEARWRNQAIGVLVSEDAGSEMTEEEIKSFRSNSKFQPREVTTSNQTKVELKMEGFSVSLIVSKNGEPPKTLWTSGGENCHSLVLSPNEEYVAYLCEMNGLLIMRIK